MSKENFTFLKNGWQKLMELNNKVQGIIDNLEHTKLYNIDYTDILGRFTESVKNYKNHPELIDIDEFSMNYVFGYHTVNGIESKLSKEAMFIEVSDYLKTLKIKGFNH